MIIGVIIHQDYPNNQERFDFAWLKTILAGSTLSLAGFHPPGHETLYLQVEGGTYDGALLIFGMGVIFSIASKMTDVSIREANTAEQLRMSPYVDKPLREHLTASNRNADEEWLVVDSQEGTWFIWSVIVSLMPKETIACDPRLLPLDINKPLWKGGPILAEL